MNSMSKSKEVPIMLHWPRGRIANQPWAHGIEK